MKEIYIVESVRTGIAKAGKNSWFANLRADDMSALVMNEVIRRAGIEGAKDQIDDVIWGGTALMKDMGFQHRPLLPGSWPVALQCTRVHR